MLAAPCSFSAHPGRLQIRLQELALELELLGAAAEVREPQPTVRALQPAEKRLVKRAGTATMTHSAVGNCTCSILANFSKKR